MDNEAIIEAMPGHIGVGPDDFGVFDDYWGEDDDVDDVDEDEEPIPAPADRILPVEEFPFQDNFDDELKRREEEWPRQIEWFGGLTAPKSNSTTFSWMVFRIAEHIRARRVERIEDTQTAIEIVRHYIYSVDGYIPWGNNTRKHMVDETERLINMYGDLRVMLSANDDPKKEESLTQQITDIEKRLKFLSAMAE